MPKSTSDRELYYKHRHLSFDQVEEIQRVARALSSELRIRILREIGLRSLSVQELAKVLGEPVSTVALNVSLLEEEGLLVSEQMPGVRGLMKKCTKMIDSLEIDLRVHPQEQVRSGQVQMPIGAFSRVSGIKPTCGLASSQEIIGVQDDPRAFYLPERLGAQILWFRQGTVEYLFPTLMFRERALRAVEISFEACSETIGYDNGWKSDIFLELNGQEIGVWESPGDFGGRQGRLNPSWWGPIHTQYGRLTTWRVTEGGSFLDEAPCSGVTLEQLRIADLDYLTVRIGVRPDARYAGGINLFGEGFGDVPQALVMQYFYT